MTTTTAKAVKVAKAATAVEESSNAKLGGVSATYVSQATCPSDCPFYKAGCYAELGYARYTTFRLNDSSERDVDAIAQQEANAIDSLSGRRNLRLHVVGDTTTDKGARIIRGAARRYKAKHGSKVWTYTHAWKKVRRASWGKPVSVLASCETPADVRLANARGYAAAIVVPHFRESKAYVHDGVKVVPCPAQTRGVSCANCLLCADGERLLANGLSIAFEAHGVRANAVRKALPVVS